MEESNMKAYVIEETSRGTQQFNIESKMLRNREIFLTDALTPESSTDLLKQLMYLEADAPGDPITLYISSPGGDVISAMAVYDYIMLMHSPVNTVCIGLAASMGAVLFLAGKERSMLAHTQIMIHDPSYSGGNFAGLKPHEIQERLDSLRQTGRMLCEVIAERTGMPKQKVAAITKKDSFYNAEEALKCGIATKILMSGNPRH